MIRLETKRVDISPAAAARRHVVIVAGGKGCSGERALFLVFYTIVGVFFSFLDRRELQPLRPLLLPVKALCPY